MVAKKKTSKKASAKTPRSRKTAAKKPSAGKQAAKGKSNGASNTPESPFAGGGLLPTTMPTPQKLRSARAGKLSPKDIELLKQRLLAKRRELLGDVNHMEGEALGRSRQDASGDLSSMPVHMADIGTDNYEQEFTLGLIENERQTLREINEALDRIEEGTYGICVATGKPIGKERLMAKPWARYTIEYARQLETGRRTG